MITSFQWLAGYADQSELKIDVKIKKSVFKKIVNREVNEVLRNTKAKTITAKQQLGLPTNIVIQRAKCIFTTFHSFIE